jgi:peptidoglycan/LPS O-acetylase OafA/YrhL
MSDHKYKRLDSIRGLAAFSVGVSHAALLAPFAAGSWLHRGITALFSGHYAVDVFFVLSGFVLTNMVREVSGPNYVAYLARRLLRLYPPLWAGLLIAYAARVVVTAHWSCHALRGCDFIGSGPTSIYGAFRDAFPTSYRLDPVVWSIRVELEASIVYPFLLLLWRGLGRWRLSLLAGAAVMSYFCSYGFGGPQPHYTLLFLGLPHFLLLFLTGIALSDYRLDRYAGAALGLGLALLLVYGFYFAGHSGIDDILATASAAAIISVAAYRCPSWLAAILDNRAVHKLGEISYSYYLLNAVVLWVIIRILGGTSLSAAATFSLWTVSAAVVTAFLAYAMNETVEKPCIRMSRRAEKLILRLFQRPVPSDRASLSEDMSGGAQTSEIERLV